MAEIWILYAFAAALFTAAAVITEKKTLLKEHAMEFSAIVAIMILILSLPLFFFIDYEKLQFLPIFLIFIITIFASIAFLLIAKSVRHMELSNSIPLLTLGPGITAILAFIFLKESLTQNQIFGIVLLIIGAYFLETRSGKSLLEPIKIFQRSRYIHFILIALVIYSTINVIDRFILFNLNMQPIAFIAFANVFLALHFIIMLHIFHDGFKGIKHGIKTTGWWIFLVAIFILGYRLSQAHAVKLANVGLVISIKRLSTLFAVIIGGELFHEKKLFRKFIITLIMILGAILIVL